MGKHCCELCWANSVDGCRHMQTKMQNVKSIQSKNHKIKMVAVVADGHARKCDNPLVHTAVGGVLGIREGFPEVPNQ